jgi:hypothetical protein
MGASIVGTYTVTVGNLVDQAFPVSTIPLDLSEEKKEFRTYRDARFNFLDFDFDAPDTYSVPEEGDLRRKAQPPFWPADLFAITAQLMERSGAYQWLANEIVKRASASTEPAWEVLIDPKAEAAENNDFGVGGYNRTILRLIGALWAEGAFFISGRHSGANAVAPGEIADRNEKAADRALAFLEDRQGREIKPGDLTALANAILRSVKGRCELGPGVAVPDDIEVKQCGWITTGAARIALRRLCQKHATYLEGLPSSPPVTQGDVDSYYNSRGRDGVGRHALIIWANAYVQHHWDILRTSQQPIGLPVVSTEPSAKDYEWWRAAMRLLIIADEAGKGMGLSRKPEKDKGASVPRTKDDRDQEFWTWPPQSGSDCRSLWGYYELAHSECLKSRHGNAHKDLFPRTLTRCFEEELGSVLPKTRSPNTGCTIRSLSHNFALLPAKGRVRARWARQSNPTDEIAYNILIVPYPYQIKSIHVSPTTDASGGEDWGFFTVNHDWLYELEDKSSNFLRIAKTTEARQNCREKFWLFLKSLMDDQPPGTVNAIVLPEAALDWETFDYVQSRLPAACPSIEMFVCGLTSYKDKQARKAAKGNFVATYLRSASKLDATNHPGWRTLHARAKHHRWRLDASQLRAYALSNRLSPNKMWWEGIELPPREMFFAEFSPGSVVTTLICEDLARIEPCQVAVRAIGPNLVLALLMDSAQAIGRWPHQYASVFSDDPGSSVLTLTSFGLIKRSNLSENRKSRQIALWREPLGGGGKEIMLPKGYDAQLISIRREYCFERTLDGRGDNGDSAIVWKFAGLIPIRSHLRPPGGKADD